MHNFITKEQACNIDFIKGIITPAIGKISNIIQCSANACNSYAYLVNKHLIIKFPQNGAQTKKLLLEKNVLSFLKNKTTLKIPQTNIIENQFTFSVHEMINGNNFHNKDYFTLSTPHKQRFCQDIALFMHELHLQTNEIKKLNPPVLKGIKNIYPIDKIKSFLTQSPLLTAQEKDFIEQFCNTYDNMSTTPQNVFSHFDIQPKNIAFDFSANKIAGIFDFGDCGLCDTSYDFIQFGIQYNTKILNNTLKYYEKLSGTHFNIDQISKASIYRILYCIMKDIEYNRPTENNLKSLRFKMKG